MDTNKITFNSIDFETATGKRNSACAVAVVTVLKGEIVNVWDTLIQPPNNYYSKTNIDIHGITPDKTKNIGSFTTIYDKLKYIINNKPLVAHGEVFDRSVLFSCMDYYNIPKNDINLTDKWYCTSRAYKRLGDKPTKLNILCEKYNIPLDHHNQLSDAIACAKLFIRYLRNYKRE